MGMTWCLGLRGGTGARRTLLCARKEALKTETDIHRFIVEQEIHTAKIATAWLNFDERGLLGVLLRAADSLAAVDASPVFSSVDLLAPSLMVFCARFLDGSILRAGTN